MSSLYGEYAIMICWGSMLLECIFQFLVFV